MYVSACWPASYSEEHIAVELMKMQVSACQPESYSLLLRKEVPAFHLVSPTKGEAAVDLMKMNASAQLSLLLWTEQAEEDDCSVELNLPAC